MHAPRSAARSAARFAPRLAALGARSAAPGPLVIAHRGASGYRPEHTEAAYRLAIGLGADAVEPDVVVSRDGVLVVRHENDISATTDVADRAEFRARKATRVIDGARITGWFAEDFTWAELRTLRCRERLGRLRPGSARYDGEFPLLRLRDVLRTVADAERAVGRRIGVVIEVKHARYFAGRGHDVVALLATEIAAAGWADRADRIVYEAFELGVLQRLRRTTASACVFLLEHAGSPADAGAGGTPRRSFAWFRSRAGLRFLASRVDGISVHKRDCLRRARRLGRLRPAPLAARARRRGLALFVWTLRPEAVFLHRAAGAARGNWREEFGVLLGCGVTGVFADHPDLAAGVRAVTRCRWPRLDLRHHERL